MGGPGGWEGGQQSVSPAYPRGPRAVRPALPGEDRRGGTERRPRRLASHNCSLRGRLSGPEPGEPHGAISCRTAAFQGLELGWLPGSEAPTPRPAPSNAEAAPLCRLLRGSTLISAWSCQAHHKPPEPYQPRNMCPPTGLPTKAQVRLGGRGGLPEAQVAPALLGGKPGKVPELL